MDRQCSSCGGFCRKSGCERENVKPEPEPVVWMYQDKSTNKVKFQKEMRAFVDHGATYEVPLYAAPQPEEVPYDPRKNNKDYERGFIDGMQHQMKSSVDIAVNAMANQQKTSGSLITEPVGRFAKFTDGIWKEVTDGSAGQPLYTAPPQREWVGLNDEEVMREFWNFYPEEYALFTDVERAFYRAIEAKLKEKNT